MLVTHTVILIWFAISSDLFMVGRKINTMPDKIIDVEMRGLEQVASRIKSLPPELSKDVIQEVGDYSLEVLKEEPPNKYVTRKAAYGQTFFTERQRRWFFANLNSGGIQVPYHRTHNMANAWRFTASSDSGLFRNAAKGAPYVYGETTQSRHEKMVGWKTIKQFLDGPLSFRSSKFRDAVQRAYQKAIRKLNLG